MLRSGCGRLAGAVSGGSHPTLGKAKRNMRQVTRKVTKSYDILSVSLTQVVLVGPTFEIWGLLAQS